MVDIINGSVAMMATLTPMATEAVSGGAVHLCTTVMASVRPAEGEPSLRPTATLLVLLSILRPKEAIGGAWRKAQDSVEEAAKRHALDAAFQQSVHSCSYLVDIPGLLAVGGRTNRGGTDCDPETTIQLAQQRWGEGTL